MQKCTDVGYMSCIADCAKIFNDSVCSKICNAQVKYVCDGQVNKTIETPF
jgi:hypothetical protein